MAKWVKLCGLGQAPSSGQVMEAEIDGVSVCLANIDGQLGALDNWCPHRRGPLGQGWVEGEAVVCPWHSWSFNLRTGVAEYPVHEKVAVFPIKVEGGDVLVEFDQG